MPARILVVEDDADLRSLLTRGLQGAGYAVAAVADGGAAVAAATDGADVIVLDIGLPDADGRDVCQALRARGVTAPVIFLTARDATPDRISGFSAGGDDYLTKPFVLAELVARIDALLRRAGGAPAIAVGSIELDPVGHAIVAGRERIELTPTEFRVLAALAAAPGQAVRRSSLVAAAWPDGAIVHDNTLDVYIRRLRRKLESLPGAPSIGTVRGVGYRLA